MSDLIGTTVSRISTMRTVIPFLPCKSHKIALLCRRAEFRLDAALGCLNRLGLRLGQKCCRQSTTRRKRKPQTGNRAVSRDMNEIGAEGGRKPTEDGGCQAVSKRETGSPHVPRHDLRQKNHHCSVVTAENAGQPEFHRQQSGKRR